MLGPAIDGPDVGWWQGGRLVAAARSGAGAALVRAACARAEAAGALRFDATGVSAKLVRQRRHREPLKTKVAHLTRLRDGRPVNAPVDPCLAAKLARLAAEHTAVCARIRNLNNCLAWSSARWLVDHATAVDATVIYVENLATMEARGGSRSLNRRLFLLMRASRRSPVVAERRRSREWQHTLCAQVRDRSLHGDAAALFEGRSTSSITWLAGCVTIQRSAGSSKCS